MASALMSRGMEIDATMSAKRMKEMVTVTRKTAQRRVRADRTPLLRRRDFLAGVPVPLSAIGSAGIGMPLSLQAFA